MFTWPVNGLLHQCIKYSRLLKCIYEEAIGNNDIINEIYYQILRPMQKAVHITILHLFTPVWIHFFLVLYKLSIDDYSFYINIIDKINDIQRKWKSNIIAINYSIKKKINSSLEQLPDDLLTHCISFLNVIEVIRIETVNFKFFNCSHLPNAISIIDDALFWRIFNLSKDSVIAFFNSVYFEHRFSKVKSLFLNRYLIYLFDGNISFIKKFTNLKSLAISSRPKLITNISSVIEFSNIYKQIHCLHLINCDNVGILLFEHLKNCELLHCLILSGCWISNDMENSANLWKYYIRFQNIFHRIQILKISWIGFRGSLHRQLSFTVVRMVIHENLKYLNLNWETGAYYVKECKYIVSPFSIKFNHLQLQKLDITPSKRLARKFMHSVIPYMKSLKSLIIRKWYNQIDDDDDDDDDDDNKYISKIIANNLNNLESISFILHESEFSEFDNVPFYFEEPDIWDPILIMLENCVKYSDWSKNILKKFDFIIKNCIAFQSHYYISRNSVALSKLKSDIDCMDSSLLYYRNRFNELAYILQQNNVKFMFQINIIFQDHGIFNKYFVSKWKQMFGLLWTITENKQNNGLVAEFCNKNINTQTFITNYFHKMM